GVELTVVVTDEPADRGACVLVGTEGRGRPAVALGRGPPEALFATPAAGVLHQADRLQTAQVVARRSGVGGQVPSQRRGRCGPTLTESSQQPGTERMRQDLDGVRGEVEM